MASDYARILEDNLREYGHGTRHLEYFRKLYSERTHFMYELLQNAEDAGATTVAFELHPDRLEVRHDGRLFDEGDVRGVCGVGEGTKSEDLTQIGKFGIGFKSVYAYTEAPAIHSGIEHFQITNYVRPEAVPARELPKGQTLFVFPFDRPDIGAEKSCNEIAAALRRLSARALLFLRHIDHIDWTMEGESGSVLRGAIPSETGRRVQLISERAGEDLETQTWLVFERPVDLEDARLSVELAFSLEQEEDSTTWRVAPVQDSSLVVYFPTEKETHLGFLVQGPFQTTPARDNIPKDTEGNERLVQEVADLVVDTLGRLREANLLTVQVLECMPIEEDNFPEGSMFRPIFDRVKEALLSRSLLPAHAEGFASGEASLLAESAELRNLLAPDDLALLLGAESPIHWITEEITADRSPILRNYLYHTLDLDELTAEGLLRKLSDEFLGSRSDEWIARLYAFVHERTALWRLRSGSLFERRVLRLEGGEMVPLLSGDRAPSASLPPEKGETAFPTVRRGIATDQGARAFLEALGFTEPDIVDEVLHLVLPRYEDLSADSWDQTDADRDMNQILRALATDSQERKKRLTDKLRRTAFVKAVNAKAGEVAFKRPGNVYLGTESLRHYFTRNASAWFLHPDYERWQDQLAELGVSSAVRVSARKGDWYGRLVLLERHGEHERSWNHFDPECEIDGLHHALKKVDEQRARFIWNELLVPLASHVRGTVEISGRKDYSHSSREDRWSKMGTLVRDAIWLPNGGGEFRKPSDLSLDELPEGFERDQALAVALEIGLPSPIEELAEGTGLDPDLLRFMMQHPQAQEAIRQLMQGEKAKRQSRAPTSDEQDEDEIVAEPPEGETEAGDLGSPGEGDGGESIGGLAPSVAARNAEGKPDRAGASSGKTEQEPSDAKGTAGSARLPVYVEPQEEAKDEDPALAAKRVAVEKAGVAKALRFEEDNGRAPTEMPQQNPGYDIESRDPDDSIRYIEVKASSGPWDVGGVALTRTEFETAVRLGATYWLYVVEKVYSEDCWIYRIQDPAGSANQFAFDGGWKALSEGT